jgi:hypothetical protein
MRAGTIVVASIGALALLLPAPAAVARQPHTHACRAVRVEGGKASRVRTTYRCSYARSALHRLLAGGVDGLPARGRWRCARKGGAWTCRRTRPRRRRGSIAFRFTAKAPAPQPGQPPLPPPVSPLQRCIDLWNGDGVNLAIIGYHLAQDHHVTRVWVFEVPNAGAATRCAVIAVVPETDPEFGNDGEVSNTIGGWTLMAQVPELGDAVDVQRRAPANANASMLPTGALALP